MALTQEEYQGLNNASLVTLFERQRSSWQTMVEEAYEYTARYIDDPRVDDVIKVLDPALRVSPTLTAYLSRKKLRQKYWTTWFGDLILDRLWDEILQNEEDEDE